MSDKPWKQEERHAAQLLTGKRYRANSGGRIDVESEHFIGQVKHVRRLSLTEVEALAIEMARLGTQRGKIGVVVVKRRAGRGIETPRLIVMLSEMFRQCSSRKSPTG